MLHRILITGLLCASLVFGQVNIFPKPSYFRETFRAPETRVELQGPVRLKDFVVGGKLELSLRAYLELVMANNTDVAIQRLSIESAQNAILRAHAPFDPSLTASFTSTRSKTPASDVLEGAQTVNSLTQPANFNYVQTLGTGTQYNVRFTGQKLSTNSAFRSFNPALNANLAFSFSQPLLRNRGSYVNKLPIMVARSRLRVSEYALRNQLMRLLSDAENAYWSVVFARENLRVRQSGLDLAGEALKRAQLELKLGALSPLDIYEPQQNYARAEIDLSQAQFNLQQQEDALRRQIGVDLDPDVRKLPIVLTETVLPPADTSTIDAEKMVEQALASRPDLKAALQNLDIDDLSIKSASNALKPDLALTGSYTSQGRGGIFYDRRNVFNDVGESSIVTQVIPGGFGDALDQLFGFNYPVYAFGLQLRLPIRSRAAAADMADAVLSKRRNTLTARSLEQQVRLEVLQAVSQVESSKAAVKLAATAVDFAQKRREAEQRKYDLGTSQMYFVLQAQNDLVTAESTLVQQSINYRRNLLNLLLRNGQLLEERGIVLQ
ncbi:MAG: TolC family protein [Bryobacterales bacterium]|nr:TolC family protein [Bryobacterales bacterium]